MAIYFYSHREKPYGCFSNFSDHGFELDGLYWSTNEHYFQAQKFINTPYFEKIRQAKTPQEAATIGRDRTLPLRSDWQESLSDVPVKDEIMFKGVLKKFETHRDIQEILLSTGEQLLVEDSPVDYYWGCGKDRSGQNKLGLILMEVRRVIFLAKS